MPYLQSALVTLEAVPLARRVGAALNVISASPGLSVEQRAELVSVAIWPPCEAATPAGVEVSARSHSTVEERRDAVALRRQGVPEREVASRYGVQPTTVRMWVQAAKRDAL